MVGFGIQFDELHTSQCACGAIRLAFRTIFRENPGFPIGQIHVQRRVLKNNSNAFSHRVRSLETSKRYRRLSARTRRVVGAWKWSLFSGSVGPSNRTILLFRPKGQSPLPRKKSPNRRDSFLGFDGGQTAIHSGFFFNGSAWVGLLPFLQTFFPELRVLQQQFFQGWSIAKRFFPFGAAPPPNPIPSNPGFFRFRTGDN